MQECAERTITVCYKDRYATYRVQFLTKEEPNQIVLQIEPLFS